MKENRTIPKDLFVYDPAVYVVGEEYCIVFNTLVEGMGWIEVDGKSYVQDCCGLIPSDLKVHKAYLPMAALDAAGSYDVVFVPVYDRKAYFPLSGERQQRTYAFRAPNPEKKDFHIYHLSDTHSAVKYPALAARFFKDDLDLVVLNGDIPNQCETMDHIMALFALSSEITHGNIPIVFSRGNHDNRGAAAQFYYRFTPTDHSGNPFFTFRIGKIWGIVLDCGEDKEDSHPEYGGMVNFHPFRLRETEFLHRVIAEREKEYDAPGVEFRFVVCHIPLEEEWNEHEREVYTDWTAQLNHIGADLILYGHAHRVEFMEEMRETRFGLQKAPSIIGGDPRGEDYKGAALTLREDGILLQFTDKKLSVLEEHYIKRAKRS